MSRNTSTGFPHRQAGVSLIIGLIMLLMLTIIALAGSQISLQQERMAGNWRESDVAFQRAESVIKGVENRLYDNNGDPGLAGLATSDFLGAAFQACSPASSPSWDYSDADMDWTNATWITDPNDPTFSADDAQYALIQYQGNPFKACRADSSNLQDQNGSPVPASPFFLIIARAKGPGGVADVTVESTFFMVKA